MPLDPAFGTSSFTNRCFAYLRHVSNSSIGTMEQNRTFPIILLGSKKSASLSIKIVSLLNWPIVLSSQGPIHRRLQCLPCGTVFLQHHILTVMCYKYNVMTGPGHVFMWFSSRSCLKVPYFMLIFWTSIRILPQFYGFRVRKG